MAIITNEQVAAAYAALATGQRSQIAELWAEDLRWLVPGHNQLSGWKNNLDEFIAIWMNSSRSWQRSGGCRTTVSAWTRSRSWPPITFRRM